MADSASEVNPASSQIHEQVAQLYRVESRRVLATLIRLLGDFDLAEEALHDAFAAAVQQWPLEGIPANPRAWLVSTGRFQAIDQQRRKIRFEARREDIALRSKPFQSSETADNDVLEDDQLRLIFTCCHPALAPDVQVALTLREVCGLTTEAIAHAFLVSPATMAQRIVRGKAKIRASGIPYQIPTAGDLPERLESLLQVIYLVFNEGYSTAPSRLESSVELSQEAIRLGQVLLELLPEPEVIGLQGLMLLQESRRFARQSPDGDLILLDQQDRDLWNREQIALGLQFVEQALQAQEWGPYTLQAAIAAVHAEAKTAAETNWERIVSIYDLLYQAIPSPIIELNRAVAIGMRDGPQAGLNLLRDIRNHGQLAGYHLAHAAEADFCRRLGLIDEAQTAYQRSLELVRQEPERRFLENRLRELEQSHSRKI